MNRVQISWNKVWKQKAVEYLKIVLGKLSTCSFGFSLFVLS